jgi:hypothetical protein
MQRAVGVGFQDCSNRAHTRKTSIDSPRRKGSRILPQSIGQFPTGNSRSWRISRCLATGSGMASRKPPKLRNSCNAALRRATISGVARTTERDVPSAGLSVAVTSIYPWRNSAGKGRCSVPSVSGSRLGVIVLIREASKDRQGVKAATRFTNSGSISALN